jgi:hypothetical protein
MRRNVGNVAFLSKLYKPLDDFACLRDFDVDVLRNDFMQAGVILIALLHKLLAEKLSELSPDSGQLLNLGLCSDVNNGMEGLIHILGRAISGDK